MMLPGALERVRDRVAEAIAHRHRRLGLPGQAVHRAEHQALLLLAIGVQLGAHLLPERRLVALPARRHPGDLERALWADRQPLAQQIPVRQRRAVQLQDLIAAADADLVGGAARLDGEHEQLGRCQPGLVAPVPRAVEHRHRDDHRRRRTLDLDVRERHRRVAAAQVADPQRRRAGVLDRLGELRPGRRPRAPLIEVTKSNVFSPACAAGELGSSTPISGR